ncbi:uncharacterized protein LOC106169287 [Lingula anatina]|uniref:Uncharacterized protein LOC106169287 n=1 Tax=Lingula anatina TaxID=7574 RepID=A0A1S3J131_LINAN|nr:uncharacterized protein LOC106169287 [Lingula anatina]|eukprot:XP_013404152.1 uncharacterized protein LOC106169287 [Lingula anatina]
MKTISFVSFYVILSALKTQGAVKNSSYPLPTQSVKNYISADGIAAWVKAWLGVLSREVNTARMKDENLTAEVQDLHRSDDNFDLIIQDVKQNVKNGIQSVSSLQADKVALSDQVTELQRQVQQLQTSLQQFAKTVTDLDKLKGILKGCTGRYTKHQDKEYYFGDPMTGRNQVMAQACCQLMGKNLVAVNSAEEFNFIEANIPQVEYSGYWCDAECINNRCIWKNSPTSVFYNPGRAGHNTDGTNGRETCLLMKWRGSVHYEDLSCTSTAFTAGFVCE